MYSPYSHTLVQLKHFFKLELADDLMYFFCCCILYILVSITQTKCLIMKKYVTAALGLV